MALQFALIGVKVVRGRVAVGLARVTLQIVIQAHVVLGTIDLSALFSHRQTTGGGHDDDDDDDGHCTTNATFRVNAGNLASIRDGRRCARRDGAGRNGIGRRRVVRGTEP